MKVHIVEPSANAHKLNEVNVLHLFQAKNLSSCRNSTEGSASTKPQGVRQKARKSKAAKVATLVTCGSAEATDDGSLNSMSNEQ
jgi:hypothetical protein